MFNSVMERLIYMNYIEHIINSMYFTVSVKIIVATLFGAIIGYDREKIGKPAGLKTHAMVCMSSCLVMIVGTLTGQEFMSDPNRLAAQVVSGMGFLCGGVIIVTARNEIKGLTTAAGLWFAACVGLVIGSRYSWIVIPAGLCFYFITHVLSKANVKAEVESERNKKKHKLEQADKDDIVS